MAVRRAVDAGRAGDLVGGSGGSGSGSADAALAAVERVVGDCNLQKFVDALTGKCVEDCAALLARALTTVSPSATSALPSTTAAPPAHGLHVDPAVISSIRGKTTKGARAAATLAMLEQQVGFDSDFRHDLKDGMLDAWNAFKQHLEATLDGQVFDQVAVMTDNVLKKLVNRFCIGDKRKKVDLSGLLTALHPRHEWLGGTDAPIVRWLRQDLSNNVDLGVVLDVSAQFTPPFLWGSKRRPPP